MPYSSTILTAYNSLKTRLETLIGVSPGGYTVALRNVFTGQGAPTANPLPFLAMQVMSVQASANLDGNRDWATKIKLRIVYDVSTSGAGLTDSLRYMAQIETCLEGWLRPDGVEGGENTLWSFTMPERADHSQLAFLEVELIFYVVAARGAN